MVYTVTDKRGQDTPQEVCRVCGSSDVHSKEYNSPTMECIEHMRNRINAYEQIINHFKSERNPIIKEEIDIEEKLGDGMCDHCKKFTKGTGKYVKRKWTCPDCR